jgi:hypothetical protein
MNLFRSEEHARRWSEFNPDLADTILPVAGWAEIFATPMFRNRGRADFVTWLSTDDGVAARRRLITMLPESARPR